MKYHAELQRKGYLTRTVRVDAFMLGTVKHPDFGFDEDMTGHPTLHIRVLLYQELITRAERRMMNLHEKVRERRFSTPRRSRGFCSRRVGKLRLFALSSP